MQLFSVRNWSKYQHYTDRTPPWIKLYNHILDDYEFSFLSDNGKLHIILIWLLASRNENKLPYNAKWIQQRIGVSSKVDLEELITLGFIEIISIENNALDDASKVLAGSEQGARLEERESKGEGEREKKESGGFKKPSIEDIKNYMLEKNATNLLATKESEKMYHFYESKNWKVGNTKMSNWKSATTNWLNRIKEFSPEKPQEEKTINIDKIQEEFNKQRGIQ